MIRSINFKIIGAIILSYVLMISLGYWVKNVLVLPRFVELEREFAFRDMERIQTAIQNEFFHIEQLCNEWSFWDDTVQFVQDLNQDFIDKNLVVNLWEEESYIQYAAFYNRELVPVYVTSYWRKEVTETFNQELSLQLANLFRSHIDVDDNTYSASSVVSTDYGTLLSVAQPIQNSEGNSPVYGMLVVARLLGNTLLTGLQEQTKIQFNVDMVSSNDQPEFLSRDQYRPVHDSYYLSEISINELRIHSVLPNINGDPVCIIQFPFSRTIYNNGLLTLRYTIIWECAIAFIVLILLMVFMNKYVLNPLQTLTLFAVNTREKNGLHERVTIYNTDEIGTLAFEFNNLLDHLNHALSDVQHSSAAKSTFLSRLSHELRTPMQAISGSAEILLYDKNNPTTTFQKERLQQIINSSDYFLNLLNDLLDLTKAESGIIQLKMETTPLMPIVHEAINVVQPLCTANQISMIDNLTEVVLETVYADRIRLKQVLINLLSNAVKYNNPGGSVTIKCLVQNESQIQINVNDTGFGIPFGKYDEVFKPFQRLDHAGKKIEGTGIGLSITKHMVDLMGGSISFTSELEKGSTFTIILNRKEMNPS